MRSIRSALLVTTVLTALTGVAAAQPVSGLYIAGGGGYNNAAQRDLTARGGVGRYFDQTLASRSGRLRFEDGFVGVLSVGYGFGNGLRLEVEGNYRENDLRLLGGFPGRNGGTAGVAFRSFSGGQRQYGAMANAFYDFSFASFGIPPSVAMPYLGAGAGWVWSDENRVRGTRLPAGANSVVVDGRDGSFAYQGIAGVAFPLTALGVPGLSVTAEYRFLGTLEQDVNGRVVTPAGTVDPRGPAVGTYRLDSAVNHSAMLGLRYVFNQPVPPAPPVAEPAPAPAAPSVARTYLVFFDWDRADLTTRAREIIAQAAANARSTGTSRIEVAGHADRSGTPQYNQRLSQRRAEVVAAELVRNGVERSQIGVTAFGESRPLVPTADGVREPQNRRVEIVLR